MASYAIAYQAKQNSFYVEEYPMAGVIHVEGTAGCFEHQRYDVPNSHHEMSTLPINDNKDFHRQ